MARQSEEKRGRQSLDDEKRLMERMAGGDDDALREVYGICSRPVFGFLLNFFSDRSTAEDVQQQVFMEVWEKSDRFDGDRGSLLAWVMTIARSRAIDYSRRRIPEPREPGGDAGPVDRNPGSGDGIDEVVEDWQFAQRLSGLPKDEAAMLRFRFQEELTQTEISTRTGVPLGTVKSRMVSGLERLRVMMEAEDE